jgi:hypothetical protein
MFGFVKFNGRNHGISDIRRDQRRKRIIFNVVFGVLGFILLNLVLYALTTV